MNLVLLRHFLKQFVSSETVTSDDEMRRTTFWVLAFLLMPGILLVIQLFFDYQGIVLRAIRYQQFDRVDDTLEWVVFLFVTYSTVTVGFLAVCVWDALTFDRRDAMVLGPLPVSGVAVVTAKIGALTIFLLIASTAVNVPNAFVFAFATADRLGLEAWVRHFGAHATATIGAALFVFAALVALRNSVGLVAGPRLAARLGSILQFLFVLALLGVVVLCPAVWKVPHAAIVNNNATGWLPTSWFLGMFEHIRGVRLVYFDPLARRAEVGTLAAVGAALATAIAGYRRQMQRALAPPASAGVTGNAWLARRLARLIVGRPGPAQATSDFVLLTLARNRSPQTLVAMNAAVGVALALAALAKLPDFSSLTRPATPTLWIPLVCAYWTTVGVRAAAFVPSELGAAWTFAINGPDRNADYWKAVRAAMLAYVLPPILALEALVTTPLLGWATAARHALFVVGAVVVLNEVAALTIDFVPFTTAYRPGHARLKTRWWLYVLGVYVFAYWPSRFEPWVLASSGHGLVMFAVFALAIVSLELAGRRFGVRWSVAQRTGDEAGGFAHVTVLDLSGAPQHA